MVKKSVEKEILAFIHRVKRPVSTREISAQLGIAWHTADRYCLKLQVKKKVAFYTIGKATAWFET